MRLNFNTRSLADSSPSQQVDATHNEYVTLYNEIDDCFGLFNRNITILSLSFGRCISHVLNACHIV